jgi:hypothetical protein
MNGELLQQEIDKLKTAGGVVNIPPGVIDIHAPICLPSSIILQGAGSGATELRLADNTNCTVIQTEGFEKFQGQNKWFAEEGVPDSFQIKGLRINGNRHSNSQGSGVELYGKRYVIEDVLIFDCCDYGFYSECGEGLETAIERSPWRDMPEAMIQTLWIRSCGKSGFVYRGPHDGFIDKLIVNGSHSKANIDSVVFEWKEHTYDGACDVHFIHAYASSGRGVFINAKVKAQFLIGDSCAHEGVYVNQGMGMVQISMIEAFMNNFHNPKAAHFNVYLGAPYTTVGTCRIRDNFGGGGVFVEGDYVQVSTLEIDGFGTGATGVKLDGRTCRIQGVIRNYAAATGIGIETAGSNLGHSIDLKIENCSLAWHSSTKVWFTNLRLYIHRHLVEQQVFLGTRPDEKHNDIKVIAAGMGTFSDGI